MDTPVSEKTLDNWAIPVNSDAYNGCSECRKIFYGIRTFDKHRIGSHSKGTRTCAKPEDLGMKVNRLGVWGSGREWKGFK